MAPKSLLFGPGERATWRGRSVVVINPNNVLIVASAMMAQVSDPRLRLIAGPDGMLTWAVIDELDEA